MMSLHDWAEQSLLLDCSSFKNTWKCSWFPIVYNTSGDKILLNISEPNLIWFDMKMEQNVMFLENVNWSQKTKNSLCMSLSKEAKPCTSVTRAIKLVLSATTPWQGCLCFPVRGFLEKMMVVWFPSMLNTPFYHWANRRGLVFRSGTQAMMFLQEGSAPDNYGPFTD